MSGNVSSNVTTELYSPNGGCQFALAPIPTSVLDPGTETCCACIVSLKLISNFNGLFHFNFIKCILISLNAQHFTKIREVIQDAYGYFLSLSQQSLIKLVSKKRAGTLGLKVMV